MARSSTRPATTPQPISKQSIPAPVPPLSSARSASICHRSPTTRPPQPSMVSAVKPTHSTRSTPQPVPRRRWVRSASTPLSVGWHSTVLPANCFSPTPVETHSMSTSASSIPVSSRAPTCGNRGARLEGRPTLPRRECIPVDPDPNDSPSLNSTPPR